MIWCMSTYLSYYIQNNRGEAMILIMNILCLMVRYNISRALVGPHNSKTEQVILKIPYVYGDILQKGGSIPPALTKC